MGIASQPSEWRLEAAETLGQKSSTSLLSSRDGSLSRSVMSGCLPVNFLFIRSVKIGTFFLFLSAVVDV